MRIIGGEARGRKISVPKGKDIRPTSNMIKESLFNSLYSVTGKAFLDLFAGSGNVGLEALSRGAQKVVFIEKDRMRGNVIRENLRHLGFEARAEVLDLDAERAVRFLAARGERFDILFADPPYERGFVTKVLSMSSLADLFAEEAMLVIQHSLREGVHGTPEDRYVLKEQKKYGDTVLSFFQKKGKE